MRSVRLFVIPVLLLIFSVPAFADSVIIKCDLPCSAARAAVERAGGTVTHSYKYVGAIAAELDLAGVLKVGSALPAGSVRKDQIIDIPAEIAGRDGRALAVDAAVAPDAASPLGVEAIETLAADPEGYSINNTLLNVTPLHAAGYTGAGQRVAVIDSGLRPSWIQLFGNVLGGEDFVGDGLGYINSANGTHGTFVGGMIANGVNLNLSTHSWRPAIQFNCPSCVSPTGRVLMLGSAPGSQIYALRVFPPTGGAPESRIIAAMERVIELRANYEAGTPETLNPDGSYDALNIGVCNMSLGGGNLHAGRDIQDQLTKAFLDHDIVLVTSAGNYGPSGTTGGSPGTGFGSLTVGAASTAVHERILRDLQYGVGVGVNYRPSASTHMAYFSSRGPTPDGRFDPEVVANGFASFSSNGGNSLSISSGTSFSAPTVAGIAAVLRQAFPDATARQIRNSIMLGADPTSMAMSSTVNDYGYGFVDALASAAILADGAAPDTDGVEGRTNRNVKSNVTAGAGIDVATDSVSRSAVLDPGERLEIYYEVKKNTTAVLITIDPAVKGAIQNAYFGDDLMLFVHSAKTGKIGASGDYPVAGVYTSGGSWMIVPSDSGLMRITILGDMTNASPIGATVHVSSLAAGNPGNASSMKIMEGDAVAVPFHVKAGAGELGVRLEWAGDWGAYPASDLDLILLSPSGDALLDGATLNSPEQVSIAAPEEGDWTAWIVGYTIPSSDESYKLQLSLDGKNLKPSN